MLHLGRRRDGGVDTGDYALLSLGACLVDDPETTFYVELKPEKRFTAEALEVTHLSLDILEAMGSRRPTR